VPAAPPPPALRGPLDTDDGRALAGDLVEMLESELVRFRHRVTHDYKIEIDRARAALVLLTRLVEAGALWTACGDSAPRAIFDSFVELIDRAESTWPVGLGEALHAELADFITATAKVAIRDDAAEPSVSERMRRCGAAPEAWWWSSQFDDDHAACWAAAAGSSERLVQVALAYGVPGDLLRRTFAAALAVAAGRAKTRRSTQRSDLVALLDKLAKGDAEALRGDGTSNSKITALAFEMLAAQPADGLAEVAVLAFQLIDLVRAGATRVPDPERFSDLATRAQRTLAGAGVQLALFLKRDLDAAVQAALPKLPR
jgi:hypothetical protein